MKSVRTQLTGLLADREVHVSFELGNRVPLLFKIFGLTVHETVFKDTHGHLTDQSAWAEGLAMRVYALAQLAFTTFSTKKLIELPYLRQGNSSMGRSTVQLEKFGDKCQNTPKVPLFSTPEQPHLN